MTYFQGGKKKKSLFNPNEPSCQKNHDAAFFVEKPLKKLMVGKTKHAHVSFFLGAMPPHFSAALINYIDTKKMKRKLTHFDDIIK